MAAAPASVVAVPIELPPINTSTVLLASAVPLIVSVWSLVLPSLPLVPLSLLMAETTGLDGAVVSMIAVNVSDTALSLPAASLAFAVML